MRALLATIDAGALVAADALPRQPLIFLETPTGEATWPDVVATGSNLPISPFGLLVARSSVPVATTTSPSERVTAPQADLVGWCADLPADAAAQVMEWARPRLCPVQVERVPLHPSAARPIVPNPTYAQRLAASIDQRNSDRFQRWIMGVGVHAANEMLARLDWTIITAKTNPFWRTAF